MSKEHAPKRKPEQAIKYIKEGLLWLVFQPWLDPRRDLYQGTDYFHQAAIHLGVLKLKKPKITPVRKH